MRFLPVLFLAACAADPAADAASQAERGREDVMVAARPVTEEDFAALLDRVEALEARNAGVDAALKASGLSVMSTEKGDPCLAYYNTEKAVWTCDDGGLADMLTSWGDRGITHMDDWAIGE